MSDDCELCRLREENERLEGVVEAKERLLRSVEMAMEGGFATSGLAYQVVECRKRAEKAEVALADMTIEEARLVTDRRNALRAAAETVMLNLRRKAGLDIGRERLDAVRAGGAGAGKGQAMTKRDKFLAAAEAFAPHKKLVAELHSLTRQRDHANDIANAAGKYIKRLEAELREYPWRATGEKLRTAKARVKRLEAAMEIPPEPVLPEVLNGERPPEADIMSWTGTASAIAYRQGYRRAFAHIRRKAGLDAPTGQTIPLADARVPNATTRATFEATDRGEGLTECADAQLGDLLREADRGPACPLCGSRENVFGGLCPWCAAKQAAKEAAKDRGPKGEPGKPAVMWKCERCGKDVADFHETPCVCSALKFHMDGPFYHHICGGRLVRHLFRDGEWVPEEKPAPQQPAE